MHTQDTSLPIPAPHPNDKRFQDLTGKEIGRLTVLFYLGRVADVHYWFCRCSCGNHVRVRQQLLSRGTTRSCGCLRRELLAAKNTTHGMATRGGPVPEYQIWKGIRSRCWNPNNRQFADWGGRGITVCERWGDFEAFYEDMGPRPSPQHQLDRIDNNGNYEPNNCRWATREEQNRNKRNTVYLTSNGTTRSLAEWSEVTGIAYNVLHRRKQLGWTDDEILEHVERQTPERSQTTRPRCTECGAEVETAEGGNGLCNRCYHRAYMRRYRLNQVEND